MNKNLLPVIALILLAGGATAQENIPVIKANGKYVNIRSDDQFIQYGWQIDAAQILDIYPTSARRVVFYTDVDSIAIAVDARKGQYNFIFLLNGKDSAHTQVRYDPSAKLGGVPTALDIRKKIEGQVFALRVPTPPVYKVENRAVWSGGDSIMIRIYYPDDGKNQRILYNIHGGAFVACNLNTHDNISRILANKTHSIVVALDYRKPPEFPYPASLDDITTVLKWIVANASSFGGDKNNIIWVGDSGGGLQAMALAIKMQQANMPKAIVLVNPAEDLRHYEHGSYALVVDSYLGGKNPDDSLISPVVAQNLSFLPPTLVITSEHDGLKPQGVALYTKLVSAGVAAKTVDIPQMGHLAGFWAVGHANADMAVAEAVKFILAQSAGGGQ
jgi:acetyl esterase